MSLEPLVGATGKSRLKGGFNRSQLNPRLERRL
jgi:hypothetical protein